MKSILKFLSDIHPFYYGLAYLICIPIFGLLVHSISLFEIKNNGVVVSDLSSCFYFSAVTITTLGYGDILPSNIPTRLLVIVEASLGVILAGLFLNSLAHKQSQIIQEDDKKIFNKIELNKRIDRLLSFDKLIQLNLKNYENYIILMTSPYGSSARPFSGTEPNFQLNHNFKFSDMKHLYHITGRLTDDFQTPTVKYFYDSLDKLTSSLETAITQNLFNDYIDLEKEIIDFILKSRQLNVRDSILDKINQKVGDEEATIFFEKKIENTTDDQVKPEQYNYMNPYFILFYFIKLSCSFINNYKAYLTEISSNNE